MKNNKVDECGVALDLLKRNDMLRCDVEQYITSTPNWIYYWANVQEIQDFLGDSDVWEDDIISIRVCHIEGSVALIDLRFYVYGEEHDLRKFVYLPTFRASVERMYKTAHGGIKEMRIKDKERELENALADVQKLREELNELKKEKHGYCI